MRRIVATLALAILLTLSVSAHAMAHTMTTGFGIANDLWGFCGERNGGWTMAVQASLKTHYIDIGTFGPWGNGIDGQFGSTTDSGVREWQYMHGLSIDGCVGPQTWDNSMAGSSHRTYVGTIGTADYWSISNHYSPSHSNYRSSLFVSPAWTSDVAVEIRYAADPDPGPISGWDCRWVEHTFDSAPCD